MILRSHEDGSNLFRSDGHRRQMLPWTSIANELRLRSQAIPSSSAQEHLPCLFNGGSNAETLEQLPRGYVTLGTEPRVYRQHEARLASGEEVSTSHANTRRKPHFKIDSLGDPFHSRALVPL